MVVDKLGRKPLLIISISFMCCSIGGLGLFFYLDKLGDSGVLNQQITAEIQWLPLVCLVVYIVAFSMGFGPLPWTMNVELYPREVQKALSPISTSSTWCFAFLVANISPYLTNALGLSGLYFVFCGLCGLGLIFCILFVPETKGKTPEDMRNYFRGHQPGHEPYSKMC